MAQLVGVVVKVNTSRLEGVISKLPGAAAEAASMTADQIVLKARAIVPVRTGALRASITKMGGGMRWVATATAGYAIFVEFGTRKMAAQPFLRPAAEAVNMSDIILQFYRMCDL
jgi:HK97 gp10 family phage protein